MRVGISSVASHAGHRRCPWSATRATGATNCLVRPRVRCGKALSRSAMAPVLKLLGGRVEERPDLMVRILLNIRLGTGDRTPSGDLLWRLAGDFPESARPGSNRPFTAPLVRWTWTGRVQRCTQRLPSQMMKRSSRC